MNKIKVFRVGEVDWIAAATKEDAIQGLADTCYDGKVDSEDMKNILEDGVEEVSPEAMKTFKHTGEDGCQGAPYPRSFQEELDDLVAKGTKFPCYFASMEI